MHGLVCPCDSIGKLISMTFCTHVQNMVNFSSLKIIKEHYVFKQDCQNHERFNPLKISPNRCYLPENNTELLQHYIRRLPRLGFEPGI